MKSPPEYILSLLQSAERFSSSELPALSNQNIIKFSLLTAHIIQKSRFSTRYNSQPQQSHRQVITCNIYSMNIVLVFPEKSH